ncbi:MAG: ATP-binding protein [Myxococcota bacterium]|nr:ATP-binding protein [Myxococcota bacterium]
MHKSAAQLVSRSAARPPVWIRAATASPWFRWAVIAVLCVGYLVAYHLVEDGAQRFALRPINLLIVVVGGVLFGLRGGLGIGIGVAVVNIGLYLRDGVFGDTLPRVAGNLLSVGIGVFAGAALGRTRDLTLTLRGEVERRQLAERQKNELTELLVHDLKNPLAAILGHSALLQQEEMSPADVKDSSESIHQSAERLKRMVLNLLDIGRAEDGQLRPRLTELDLNELALEIQDSVQRQVRDRHQRLELEEAPQQGMVIADPELVRRLLINLVDNAIKYTPQDRTIRLRIEPQTDAVVVAVADEGPGIPPGFEEKIFDKYVRLDASPEAAYASRGLGLTFCRMAAEVHGGRIWVDPALPHGSVFRVRLPRSGPRLPSVPPRG